MQKHKKNTDWVVIVRCQHKWSPDVDATSLPLDVEVAEATATVVVWDQRVGQWILHITHGKSHLSHDISHTMNFTPNKYTDLALITINWYLPEQDYMQFFCYILINRKTPKSKWTIWNMASIQECRLGRFQWYGGGSPPFTHPISVSGTDVEDGVTKAPRLRDSSLVGAQDDRRVGIVGNTNGHLSGSSLVRECAVVCKNLKLKNREKIFYSTDSYKVWCTFPQLIH